MMLTCSLTLTPSMFSTLFCNKREEKRKISLASHGFEQLPADVSLPFNFGSLSTSGSAFLESTADPSRFEGEMSAESVALLTLNFY